MDLGPDDFGGQPWRVATKTWSSRGRMPQEVHRQFLEAGCDVIETDTFGATSLVLAEYDLQDQAYELNVKAAQLAREMADRYSTPEKPRLWRAPWAPPPSCPPGMWVSMRCAIPLPNRPWSAGRQRRSVHHRNLPRPSADQGSLGRP